MPFPALLLALAAGCALHRAPAGPEGYQLSVRGARHTAVDLLRDDPDADKIYIEVDLGLDEPALFLVDTGASVSVVNGAIVEALGLTPSAGKGVIEGLGGVAPWTSVVVPQVRIGEIELLHLEAATGIEGIPAFGGGPPLQGILGNDVWQRFVLAVDYPAARLELALPDPARPATAGVPMLFDGLHCYSLVRMSSGPLQHQALLALDTGARGVLLSAFAGTPLAERATEGEEPVMGIGGGEDLPATSFIRRTRHIPLDRVELGGVQVEGVEEAQWVNFEGQARVGPASMPGLVGYTALRDHRAVFDFPAQRFALLPSAGPAREIDGHARLLEGERQRHGDDPTRGFERARLLAWMDDEAGAIEQVRAYLAVAPDDAEATVFLARLHAFRGELEAYRATLASLPPERLAEQGELLTVVNDLVLAGQPERSLDLARTVADRLPDDEQAQLALADALMASGDPARARRALGEANRLAESPDGHLLRRTRVALAEGDRMGALTHARRLLEILPSSGFAIWFYASLIQGEDEERTLRADLDRAMARLHPEDRPLDFWMAAMARLDEPSEVERLFAEGTARDCPEAEEGPERANCEAWYRALAGLDLDQAMDQSLAATGAEPARSDFLDTLAVVYWRRGQLDDALATARKAWTLSPADIYLAWQVERLERLLSGEPGSG